MNIRLRGEGVAAACCAHLLTKAGLAPAIERVSRPPPPVVMLSDQALALLGDVLGADFALSGTPIDRRVVAWGASDPVAVPHTATIVSGTALNAAIEPLLDGGASDPAPADLTIHAAPPFPFGRLRRFGDRDATAVAVRLPHADDRSASWIEAVAAGWLFLVPAAPGEGWLLAVGDGIDILMDQSRLIGPRIEPLDRPRTTFATSPAMLDPVCAPGALACGSSALAFDPICGDGTSQAVREAILAVAVAVAIGEGGDAHQLQDHYRAMLTAAMRRHLRLSIDFYRSGGDSPWWQDQVADLAEGYRWCTERLATMPEPRFLLRGDRLVPREDAA